MNLLELQVGNIKDIFFIPSQGEFDFRFLPVSDKSKLNKLILQANFKV